MVGAPNARTKVDNQQTAELNGNPGVDTHFAQLSGGPGDDTRAVTLVGDVTDTHAAQFDGSGSITFTGGTGLFIPNVVTQRESADSTGLAITTRPNIWRDVRSYNVGSPGAGKSLYIIFMVHISLISTVNPRVRSFNWRILKNNNSTIASGRFSISSIFSRPGHFSFIDNEPGEDANTYKLQINLSGSTGDTISFVAGSLHNSAITITEDTHQAIFSGVTGTDTHRAVLEGSNALSIEPKLLGDSGVDTHTVTLIGDPINASFSSPSTTTLTAGSAGANSNLATTSQSVPFLTRTVIANTFTENILVGFQISIRAFPNAVSWMFRKSNGVVFSQGQRSASSDTLYFESGVFLDNDPLIGNNTYELFSWGSSHNIYCASVEAVSYIITDDHSAELIGEKTDTHAYQLSGSVTPDTHAVTLQGSPPVDTHNVNLIGNVRGKSPIGGRLR